MRLTKMAFNNQTYLMKQNHYWATAICSFFCIYSFASALEHFEEDVERAIEDVASFQFRSDGKYDVICTNGAYQIATKEDIQSNNVCGGGAVGPFKILSVQKRPDGKFNVLCADLTSQIATADDIRLGRACSGGAPTLLGNSTIPEGFQYIQGGWLAGYRIRIPDAVTLTHLGMYLENASKSNVTLGLYRDKNGLPSERVSHTGKVLVLGGRNEIPVLAPVQLTGGDYWIFWGTYDEALLGTSKGKTVRKVAKFVTAELPSLFQPLDLQNAAEDNFTWNLYFRFLPFRFG